MIPQLEERYTHDLPGYIDNSFYLPKSEKVLQEIKWLLNQIQNTERPKLTNNEMFAINS